MKTILVTGANGFVGRRMCQHLAEHGFRVRGTVRQLPAAGAVPGANIDYVASGPIDEATDWRRHLAGIDAIVHCAARVNVVRETAADPLAEFRRVNVGGTERLARQAAAAGVRRLVLISAIGAAVAAAHRPDDPPLTPYQISKLESETALFRVATDTGLEAVALRPPLILGPGAPGFIRLLLKAIAAKVPLPLASIRNRRSIIYVGNLVDAARLCLDHPAAAGRIFPVSDGDPVSTPDFVRALATVLHRRALLVPFPPQLLLLAGRLTGQEFATRGLVCDQVIDDSEIRTRLGWRPPYSMAAALAEMAAAEHT